MFLDGAFNHIIRRKCERQLEIKNIYLRISAAIFEVRDEHSVTAGNYIVEKLM